ncbi:FHA domain protein [Aspergillus candidus]|uniref:FHA domain-containing protein n=1 Tax=Aspergillus candidus TaxID=41067 RepID=A0A2I2F5C7_ASPCN|nr:hypothetical protein BDW47DRAFT_119272 [Aspergillus candidus]PLB35788.1 hypothetical protein BDW47DRAFT_119272 [Aspergillus candidus]
MELPTTKAVMKLHSSGINDTYPCRYLTFTAFSPEFVVGRASNRQTKNLTPALDNAFYESRVMSRNHATLWAGLDEKKIYIRDGGSMHGTWLNGEKVPGDKDTAIHDGDLVTFGAQVIRGTETFSPLKVRCECEWPGPGLVSCNLSNLEASDMMSRDSTFPRRQSDNTFVVPDDDDDNEFQITHPNGSAFSPIDANSEAGDSESSGSSGLSPHELESLVTSPWKNDSSSIVIGDNDEATKGDALTNGQSLHMDGAGIGNSELSPIDLDGDRPLATPRMTPPSVVVKDGEPVRLLAHQLGDFMDQGSVMFDSDAESSESKSDLGEVEDYSDDDSISESSSGSEAEESKMDHEPAKASSPQPRVWYPPLVGNPWLYEGKAHGVNSASNDNHGQKIPDVKLNPIIGGFEPSNTTGAPSGCKLAPFQPRLGHCFTNFAVSSAPEDWSPQEDSRQPLAHGVTSLSPVRNLPLYHDGPFVNAHVPNLEDVAGSDARESALNRIDDAPHAENNVDVADVREKNSSARATNNTRVSISDIIEASSVAHDTTQNPPRKRKALDMEIDSLVCDMATGKHRAFSAGPSLCAEHPVTSSTNDDSYLPDAQPQEGVPHLETRSEIIDGLASLNGTQTSNSVSSPISAPVSGPDRERPSKRPRTSPQTIRSHAASAAVGAIVGAVGMVAALAALPADYFQ